MGRIRSAVVVAITFIGAAATLGTAAPVGATGPNSIIGTVTDVSGSPLAGIEYSTGWIWGPAPQTAVDGTYSIDNLSPDSAYQVSFHDPSGLHADVLSEPATVLDTGPAVLDVTMPDAQLAVRGRVTDPDGNPVAGVVVRDQIDYWVSVTTNSEGYYGLSGLTDGSHDLTFDTASAAPNLRPATLSGVVVQAGSTTVADVTLQQYGRIELAVTAGGLPATASATLWRDMEFDQPAGFANADANGVMSFNIGEDGEYFLQIYAEQPGYAGEFYPDTIDREQAQRLHIVGDQEVLLTAELEQQAIITGTVSMPDGSPGDSYSVNARPAGLADEAAMELPACNLPDENDPPGTFRIGCLHPSADWVLKAFGNGVADNEYYQDSQSPNHATVIQVEPGQLVDGIVIQLDPRSPDPALTGLSRQYFLAGTTTPGVHVYGANFPSDPFAMTLSTEFWFSGINATIDVTSVISPNEAIATVTVDPGEVGTTPINKPLMLNTSIGGTASCTCSLFLGDSSTEVAAMSGRVTDRNRHPVPFVTVDVRTPNPNTTGGYDIRTAITGPDGRWNADGLLPGSYQVVFHGTSELDGQWWNKKSTDAGATSLTLTAGQTTTNIDARLGQRAHITVVRANQKYHTPDVSFDLVGDGLSPITGDFRVSIDYGWGLVPLQAASISRHRLHVSGSVSGTGPFDVVVEWTQADGSVASTRCVSCITVYGQLELYGYFNTISRGTSTTLTYDGNNLVDLRSVKVSGKGVTINSWSINEYGQLVVVVTAKANAATGPRTITVQRIDGATATAELEVV